MFPSKIDEYEDLLTANRIWVGRTQGVGYISAEDAVAWGLTGPSLRAAGVPLDLRKTNPYSSYDEFQFDVPTRTESDVYSRYLVRIAEMRESVKIIRQALDGMPEGPWKADADGIVLPDRDHMKAEMEALIYQFKIVTEGFRVPPGEVFQAIESPRGIMGYYVVADGTTKPYRCHMRAASFCNLQALPKMIEGRLIADVVAIIGSIDIVLGDVDR
jgi:NADH-quinone oxidoreductase subunit D